MSSSGGVFSQTLQSITDTKLAELSKKRTYFEDQKATLLRTVNDETDQQQRVRLLLNAVKESFQLKSTKRKRDELAVWTSGQQPRADTHLEVYVNNLQRFLAQARYDPSISSQLLQDWENSLIKQLDIQSLKYQYATLYGELVTEWLSTEKASEASKIKDTEEVEGFERIEWKKKDEARAEWEKIVFEPFEVDQMAIGTYLAKIFGNNGTDEKALKALKNLREKVEVFEAGLASPSQFNKDVLQWTINGLLTSDLLNDEKKAVLRDFLGNPAILVEVADVLNMRMASLQTWEWEDHVPLEMRRNLNGDSRIYMHEDLLQAIFLQYIGVKWSVFFKSAFKAFSNAEGAWISNNTIIPENDGLWRNFYLAGGLNNSSSNPNVQSRRRELHQSRYFLSQLLDGENQQASSADGEAEANYTGHAMQDYQMQNGLAERALADRLRAQRTQEEIGIVSQRSDRMVQQSSAPMNAQVRRQMQMQQQAQQQAQQAQQQAQSMQYQQQLMVLEQQNRKRLLQQRQTANPFRANGEDGDEDSNGDAKPKSTMHTKQLLLHLLSTEIILNTELHGEITCLRSEFDSWLPTLSHSTIISVLNFLGFSRKWMTFFKTFLEAPLKFIEDGPSGQVRRRKRGIPSSHTLSDVFGEVILFCMDYSVNQSTKGTLLYRMHDDFWIWSTSHETIVTAWSSVTEFANIMGVSLNAAKTGTVRILKDKTAPAVLDSSLPRGEIRWGFLYLDSSTGRFLIDQKMVDSHILELQRQLEGKTSIFSYIQAWNTYAGTFFTSNFGKPANCFGREHVDMMLSTLERIQRCIFPSATSGENNINSIAKYLKATIAERFGITDIPDGFLYFTTPLGGLELHNPFIGLLQLRDSLWKKPYSAFEPFFPAEMREYENDKSTFDHLQLNTALTRTNNFPYQPTDPLAEFFSYKEYSKYREDFNHYAVGGEASLLKYYNGLLEMPKEESVMADEGMRNALNSLVLAESSNGINAEWDKMSNYWKWVVQLYGKEMVERFGSLNAVDPGVLPVGMVGLVRGGRVKWEG